MRIAGAGNPPSGVLPTPVDTIEEFKVATAGQTADFNGSSGSQVSVVTKRGTNQFHGTGYYYYSTRATWAAPTRGTTTTRPAETSATRRFRSPTTIDTAEPWAVRCCRGSGAARRTSSSATKASTTRNRRLSTSRCRPTRCARASFRSTKAAPTFPTTSIPSR